MWDLKKIFFKVKLIETEYKSGCQGPGGGGREKGLVGERTEISSSKMSNALGSDV